MPTNVGIIDPMLGIPSEHQKPSYAFIKPLLRDHVWPEFLRENALRLFKLDG